MAKEISISQCMIVKNEEKNIRRALSWGKGIVKEQIVVDTGSTDKTVEIAESMGAKIFYFKWCDDFSAAKNYAIEQACGDWIAFLDADEYFTPEDAGKLLEVIRTAEKKFNQNGSPDVIRATWAQLNDEGRVFAVSEQDRIFRNRKDIRYRKPIHEVLSASGRDLQLIDATEALSIMHTGYLRSIIAEKGKRNVPLLRKAVQEDPDDYDSWAYLAEALSAEDNYMEALRTSEKVMEEGLYKAELPQVNTALMTWYTSASSGKTGDPAKYKKQAYELYERYIKAGFSYPDIEFGMGCYLQKIGDTESVVRFFETALQKLEHYKGVDTLKMAGRLDHIYAYLALCYSERQDPRKAVYYCTLSLRVDKYQEPPLSCLLSLLKNDRNTAAAQAYAFLGKIYDTSSLKDKLFILKLAMKAEYQELSEFIRENMSKKELEALNTSAEPSWSERQDTLKKEYPRIPVRNRTDQNFLYLVNELREEKADSLYEKALLKELVDMLREHWEDIVNLYERLDDYRSRQCLYGLLETWMHRENRIMSLARDNGLEFWDMDIIPTAEGMTCVEISEHLLESLNGFLYTYDDTYQKILCFEEEKEEKKSADTKEAFRGHKNISITKTGIENLCLDEIIKESFDLVGIDVSAELIPLLKGSREHICNDHPILAVSLGIECSNLWTVPKILKEWVPEYKFYLRYYGKEAIPNRVVLFAAV